MPEPLKILIVDNDENDLFLWQMIIENFGHQVFTAKSGQQALAFLQQQIPDLILLDLKMPGMSGIEVSKHLRSVPAYQNIPIIMLTSSDDLGDKLQSFEHGVDDYVTKEMEPLEISKRIQAVIKRYQRSLDTNPLTHLPGNNAIEREIQKRIESNQKFAIAYCDLDHFKAFNDAYGFVNGDRVIRFTAEVLQNVLKQMGNPNDFLGHVGGDDFIFLTTPQKMEAICTQILDQFKQGIGSFYDPQDAERGYFEARNRQGKVQQFPLVSLSIAVVSNQNRPIQSVAQASLIASEVKKLAKSRAGNSYVIDQRQE